MVFTLSGVLGGCVSPLERARDAWDGGQGDFAAAEVAYAEALVQRRFETQARAELLDLYLTQADVETRLGHQDRANELYQSALRIEPQSVEAMVGRARVLLSLNQFDQGLSTIDMAIGYGCTTCATIKAALLEGRGDLRLAAERWQDAEGDYLRAFALVSKPSTMMAIVRARYAQRKLDEAIDGLMQARELIEPHQTELQSRYLQLRRAIVLLAIERRQVALADQLMDLAPNGVPVEIELELALEVADELNDAGHPNIALSRIEPLLDGRREHGLNASQMGEVRQLAASLYVTRARQNVSLREFEAADRDLERAAALQPDADWLVLQRVVLQIGGGEFKSATALLNTVSPHTEGHGQVTALLLARKAQLAIQAGKIQRGGAFLDAARELAPELPEVHLALAVWLAKTPVELSEADEKLLDTKTSVVTYPGPVTRVGEALSELDWSRRQMRGLGAGYPYQAADTIARLDAVEAELRAFYPYPVEFQNQPHTEFVFHNRRTETASVSVRRPQNTQVSASFELEPGGSRAVLVADLGPVWLDDGARSTTILAEPYTRVLVDLE